MKQIEKDRICCYCLGCNRLLDEEFEGVRNCPNFMKGRPTGGDYIQEIKTKLGVK